MFNPEKSEKKDRKEISGPIGHDILEDARGLMKQINFGGMSSEEQNAHMERLTPKVEKSIEAAKNTREVRFFLESLETIMKTKDEYAETASDSNSLIGRARYFAREKIEELNSESN